MANIKSAKKRILVTETKTARNKAIKSKVKTMVKKVEAAVEAKDVAAAQDALKAAISEINKAGQKVFTTRRHVPEKSLVFPRLYLQSLNLQSILY